MPTYSNVARFHFAYRGDCMVRVGDTGKTIALKQGDLVSEKEKVEVPGLPTEPGGLPTRPNINLGNAIPMTQPSKEPMDKSSDEDPSNGQPAEPETAAPDAEQKNDGDEKTGGGEENSASENSDSGAGNDESENDQSENDQSEN